MGAFGNHQQTKSPNAEMPLRLTYYPTLVIVSAVAISVWQLLFTPDALDGAENPKNDEILLTCQMGTSAADKTSFVINPRLHTAKFMDPTAAVIGKLTTAENTYTLHFSKSKDRYAMIIEINRYSGKLSWEHGVPPFGSFNPSNVFRSGVCSRMKNVTKF